MADSISRYAEAAVDRINDVLTNPANHELLAILKGTRNGEYEGMGAK